MAWWFGEASLTVSTGIHIRRDQCRRRDVAVAARLGRHGRGGAAPRCCRLRVSSAPRDIVVDVQGNARRHCTCLEDRVGIALDASNRLGALGSRADAPVPYRTRSMDTARLRATARYRSLGATHAVAQSASSPRTVDAPLSVAAIFGHVSPSPAHALIYLKFSIVRIMFFV